MPTNLKRTTGPRKASHLRSTSIAPVAHPLNAVAHSSDLPTIRRADRTELPRANKSLLHASAAEQPRTTLLWWPAVDADRLDLEASWTAGG